MCREEEEEEAQRELEQRKALEEEVRALQQGWPGVSRKEQIHTLRVFFSPKTDQWAERMKLTGGNRGMTGRRGRKETGGKERMKGYK